MNRNPDRPALRAYARSQKGRKRSRHIMLSHWANPEWRAKTIASQKAKRKTKSVEERFWDKVKKQRNGCWVWQGKPRTKKGYGRFYVRGKTYSAHCFSYEFLVGPIPEGLTLDHLCRNTMCVNPDHLEPTTNKENILRGMAPSACNARKTSCKRGHPLSGDNLYTPPSRPNERRCKKCDLARVRAYRAKKRQ